MLGLVTVFTLPPILLLLSLAKDYSCSFTLATFGMSGHGLWGSGWFIIAGRYMSCQSTGPKTLPVGSHLKYM